MDARSTVFRKGVDCTTLGGAQPVNIDTHELALALSCVPSGTSANRSTAITVDEVHQLERAWPQALVNGDIELLEEIWAEDFSLTTPDGTQITRDDCLAGLCGDEIQFELFAAIVTSGARTKIGTQT